MTRRISARRGGRASGRVPTFASQIRAFGAHAHFHVRSGCTDSGGTSTWVDAISGYALTNSGGTRMTYSTSVAALNGRPGWTAVAASTQYLSTANSTLAAIIDGAQAYSLYVVRKAATVTGSTRIIVAGGSTTASEWMYHGHSVTNGAIVYSRRVVAGTTTTTGSVNSGTAIVLDTYVYDAATISAWAGASASISAVANTRAPTLNRVIVGALMDTGALSNYFDGAVGDIVIFLAAHTTAQRLYVTGLINAQFGM